VLRCQGEKGHKFFGKSPRKKRKINRGGGEAGSNLGYVYFIKRRTRTMQGNCRLCLPGSYTAGSGIVGKIYETCFCHELSKRLIQFERQVPIPIIYDGIRFDDGFKIDVLVEEIIVVEFKCVDAIHPVHHAQLMTYLKLVSTHVGFLINFNVALIKQGIRRICI
jgi:GxxExxY protein